MRVLAPTAPAPHPLPSPPHHTRYVLLHHVMGELQGLRNVWAYVEGGMGSVSRAIAQSAESFGATLVTEAVSWPRQVKAYVVLCLQAVPLSLAACE